MPTLFTLELAVLDLAFLKLVIPEPVEHFKRLAKHFATDFEQN
jgi:hypothetical protein